MAPRNAPTPGGDINPYDFLSLIAGLAAGQSKPTQAGINRLFMPEVGALTGTYFGDFGQTSDQQEAATMLQLAPDVLRASELLRYYYNKNYQLTLDRLHRAVSSVLLHNNVCVVLLD